MPRPRSRAGFVDRIRATVARRYRQRTRALQLRDGWRSLGLPDQLHAVPRRRRCGQPRLSQPGGRRLDLGRQSRADPRHDRARHPQCRRQVPPVDDAALRRRRPAHGHPGRGGNGLCAEPVRQGDKATPEGTRLFQEQCAACHGPEGKGNQELGAPSLADGIWLYGGDRDAIYRSIFYCPQRAACRPGADASTKRPSRCSRSTSTRWAAAAGQYAGASWGIDTKVREDDAVSARRTEGRAAALRHPHQGLPAGDCRPVASNQMGRPRLVARPLLSGALAALGPGTQCALPGDSD